MKGVVSANVSRFCGIDWRSRCQISLEGLEGLSDTSRGRAELETRGLDSYHLHQNDYSFDALQA